MYRRTFAFGGPLLVAAALALMTPGTSQAAQHSGSHGGFHGGGFHGGGFRAGGFHTVGIRTGGYHVGGYLGGAHYQPSYGSYHPGLYHSHPYYGSYYGGLPYYYSDYGNSVPYTFAYSNLLSGSAYDPGYSGSYYQPASIFGAATTFRDPLVLGSGQPATQPGTDARITLTVPADADVWFDDVRMKTTGSVREFESPPLAPGKYTYAVKARWNENGHEVTQTQTVEVTPGASVNLRFPVAAETTGQAPAAKNN